MGTLEEFKVLGNEEGGSNSYANGYADGKSARARDEVLSPYLYIGIDDYARGFRAGFFERIKSAAAKDGQNVTRRLMGE
jgi:hypothetical protein